MEHSNDLDRVNHALGLDGAPEPSPYYDEDSPRDVHASHAWEIRHRWMECARCGVRDHWPAGGRRCRVPHGKASVVPLHDALDVLSADLRAFGAWWDDHDHPPQLPSLDEWAANFFEWRIER